MLSKLIPVAIKFAVIQLISFEVYKRVAADSLNREQALALVSNRIAELEQARNGAASIYVETVIEELQRLHASLSESKTEDPIKMIGTYIDDLLKTLGQGVDQGMAFIDGIYANLADALKRASGKDSSQ